MAKVTVIVEDNEEGGVTLNFFADPAIGRDEKGTFAQQMGLAMVGLLKDFVEEDGDGKFEITGRSDTTE